MTLYTKTPGPSTWQCDNTAAVFKRDPVFVKCFSPWRATREQGQETWKVPVKEKGQLWSHDVKGMDFMINLSLEGCLWFLQCSQRSFINYSEDFTCLIILENLTNNDNMLEIFEFVETNIFQAAECFLCAASNDVDWRDIWGVSPLKGVIRGVACIVCVKAELLPCVRVTLWAALWPLQNPHHLCCCILSHYNQTSFSF